jgi:hypothetical protein
MKNVILLLISLLILSCNNPKDTDIENLKSKNDILIKKNDSLVFKIKELELKANYWFDEELQSNDFLKKGIKDSKNFIENSLRNKPELIPLKAVLGGSMNFGNIQILGNKYIIADYSDGHIEGKSIYIYKLNNKGNLEFEVVDSENY